MRGKHSERLPRMLGNKIERSSLSLVVEVAVKRFVVLTFERHDRILRLSSYKLGNEEFGA